MKFSISAACGSHIGRVRLKNEDNYYFYGSWRDPADCGIVGTMYHLDANPKNLFLAVCDGMGGESFGDIASYSAVRKMACPKWQYVHRFKKNEIFLRGFVKELNQAVLDAKKQLLTNHMGTTLEGLWFTQRCVYSFGAGDSRCYLLRNRELVQISRDDVEDLFCNTKRKPPLTQYLGIDPLEMELDPRIQKLDIRYGDCYLLCSDGVSDMLSIHQIEAILNSEQNPKCAVDRVIEESLLSGGKDNITAIVCKICEGGFRNDE